MVWVVVVGRCDREIYDGRDQVTTRYRYTVLFEPANEGGYVVTCPELPGLVTEGDTLGQPFVELPHRA